MSDAPPTAPEWVPLDAGERVVLRETPSKNLVLAALAIGFVLLIVMSISVGFLTDDIEIGQIVSFFVLVLIVALLVAAYAFINSREYVLSNAGAYRGVGLRNTRVLSVDLADVDDVSVHQPRWQRFLNVGTLQFATDGDRSIEFSLVENPQGVHQRTLQVATGTEGRTETK